MKKIPLHSVVLVDSKNKDLISGHFAHYEIIDQEEIVRSLVGEPNRADLQDVVNDEIIKRIAAKTSLGERAVVIADCSSANGRIDKVKIPRRDGCPIFYIVESVNPNRHETLKTMCRGDGVANVINTEVEDFEVVSKVLPQDIMSQIVARGFNGITVIADVHNMAESLKGAIEWATARKHFIIFLGDVIDYGPDPIECINLVYDVVTRGRGISCMGNHERKIIRWLEQDRKGEIKIRLSEGNRITTTAFEGLRYDDRYRAESKFRAIVNLSYHHIVIENFLFAHGAAEPEMFNVHQTRLSGNLENMCLFGEVDRKTKTDDSGFPNRVYNWVERIPAGKTVMVGHDIRSTVFPHQETNANGGNVVFLDTGSGKGGKLTTADIQFKEGQLVLQSFAYH